MTEPAHTHYVLDPPGGGRSGLDVIAEVDSTPSPPHPLTASLTRFYVPGPGIDEPLALWAPGVGSGQSAGDWYYYHADHLGSTTEMTDAQGNIVNQYRYTAYGSRLAALEAVPQPFGFTGRTWDDAARLAHYRFRWYDPEVGRFVSEDPLLLSLVAPGTLGDLERHLRARLSDDLNLAGNAYTYVESNPINYTDPLGLGHPYRCEVLKVIQCFPQCSKGCDPTSDEYFACIVWCQGPGLAQCIASPGKGKFPKNPHCDKKDCKKKEQ